MYCHSPGVLLTFITLTALHSPFHPQKDRDTGHRSARTIAHFHRERECCEFCAFLLSSWSCSLFHPLNRFELYIRVFFQVSVVEMGL